MEVLHNENAEWLKELKKERVEARQEDIVITAEMVTARSKKIPNWKAPCPDGVQGYCIKKLTALHEQKADHMNDLINNRVIILVWMTTGRTLLCQKKTKKEVVLLITIDPYPVYHLATTCLETDDRDHS